MGVAVETRTTKASRPAGADLARKLREAIESKRAQVAVVGMGYVGLPLALSFAESGLRVLGIDTDGEKVVRLKHSESYLRHIPPTRIHPVRETGFFTPTTDFRRLRAADAVLVCVPTPLGAHNEPDLSYIAKTAQCVQATLRPGQLIVLESTTYPGTTEEVVLPILEESGLRCFPDQDKENQSDFFLAFSPEREDPGNTKLRTRGIPKVVGGVNALSTELAVQLYSQAFDRIIPVSSARVAEMTKLLENIYRCVNIALINELKLLCLRMGIDVWEVIEAASTKPFGFTPFYPGPGMGGHCIPIDPFYLTWKAKEYDFPTRFIELAGEINSAMPYHVVESVATALDRRGHTLSGAKILILGVAYKKDVDDMRESPALKIMELLAGRGAHVSYHDPYVPKLPRMRRHNFGLSSISLSPEALRAQDCTLIVTDHSCYDYEEIVRESPLVVDSRHATARVRGHRDKIVYC